jgi:hypothetical protein
LIDPPAVAAAVREAMKFAAENSER